MVDIFDKYGLPQAVRFDHDSRWAYDWPESVQANTLQRSLSWQLALADCIAGLFGLVA